MTDQGLESLSPADYLSILRHRKYFFLVPAVLVLLAGVMVVMVLPPVFRSSATVLIESQQIPQDFVRSTITTFADERIEVIRQRVMTTENLVPIVEKFNLYGENRKRMSPAELADLVRENFQITLVSANTAGRGGTQRLTIAFNVHFNDRNPVAAQRVVSEFVTLFLSQDADIRTTKTRETHEFLLAQAGKLGESIAELERRIAVFKTENRSQLPESASANQSLMERLSGAHRDVMARLQALRNSVGVLEAQLATGAATPVPGAQGIPQLEQELARLLSIYTDRHPEVVALRERIAQMRSVAPGGDVAAMDPASVQLRSQISASRSEIAFLEGERARLEAQLAEVEARINSAPEVERQYNELLRDMDNLRAEYSEVKSKALESEIALQMETEQKGERFKLIEAPAVPRDPFSPDRPKLLVMVLFLSMVAGGGAVLLIELLQPLLRGARNIAAVLGDQPLVTVPYIETTQDIQRARTRRRIVIQAVVAVVLAGVIAVHFLVIELDLLWYQLMQRLGGL